MLPTFSDDMWIIVTVAASAICVAASTVATASAIFLGWSSDRRHIVELERRLTAV